MIIKKKKSSFQIPVAFFVNSVDFYILQIKDVRKGTCPSKRKGSCEPSTAPTKKQPFFFLIFKLNYKRKKSCDCD